MIGNDDTRPSDPESTSGPISPSIRRKFGPSLRVSFAPSITLELSDQACMILTNLMNKTNHDAQEVFMKSLFLYQAAVEAEKEGRKMVIIDQDGEIDQEITGL